MKNLRFDYAFATICNVFHVWPCFKIEHHWHSYTNDVGFALVIGWLKWQAGIRFYFKDKA